MIDKNLVTQKREKPFKVGIIGCGRVAEHHLKFLVQSKKVQVVGLVDKNINQARKLGEKYGIQNLFSSIDNLLNFGAIDALHITTPPQYHFEQACKAIERGIHLFIEKPITLSFDNTQKLYTLAEDKNIKICPDFINLFNPIILEAKKFIQQNNLGRLIHAECYLSVNLNDPELKEAIGLHWSYTLPGGVMQNNITHPIYLVMDWIGHAKSITVYPRQFGILPQELTNHIDILINGEKANGKITITVVPKHENYYLRLFFDKGTVTVDFVTQTYTIEKVNNLPRSVNRVMTNFVRSHQLTGGSIRNVLRFLQKKIVPYYGLKYLIESFYGWIDGNNVSPISKELSLEVSYAEENIVNRAGKVHFDNHPRPSTQKGISKKEKILVTGGTGYVGSEVIRQLVDAGYHVRAYVRKTSHTDALENLGVELVYGDIREAEILKQAAQGMDVIVHFAAALKGSKSFMLDCTVNGTINVAEAARQAKVKRVIYISSFSVYDYLYTKNGKVITEESLLETQGEKRGTYSWVKRQAEDIALSNLSGDGPAWTILRPSLIFGNGHDLTSLVGPKIGNLVISFGRRRKHLKLIHVNDVAKAILLALDNDSTCNRVFNLSHEDHITVNDLVKKCFKKSSLKKYHVVYAPYSAGLIGIVMLKILKALLGRGPNMNRVRLAYLCRDLLADSKAFRNATGWNPENELLTQLIKEAEIA